MFWEQMWVFGCGNLYMSSSYVTLLFHSRLTFKMYEEWWSEQIDKGKQTSQNETNLKTRSLNLSVQPHHLLDFSGKSFIFYVLPSLADENIYFFTHKYTGNSPSLIHFITYIQPIALTSICGAVLKAGLWVCTLRITLICLL